MRIAWMLGAAALATAAQAASTIPDGTYAGTGRFVGRDGMAGEYSVETTVREQVVSSRYKYTVNGAERSESHTLRLAADQPFFDVLDEGQQVIGTGYCYEAQCSYRASFGPVAVEETLSFSAGTLSKFGAKRGEGFAVVWKEVLQRR